MKFTPQDFAAAATRVLLALELDDDKDDFKDAESSLIAQLQAEEFVPSDWVMGVEPGCVEHGVVHVVCGPPSQPEDASEYVWLQIDPQTGEVQRV